jgi:hypothetical protein
MKQDFYNKEWKYVMPIHSTFPYDITKWSSSFSIQLFLTVKDFHKLYFFWDDYIEFPRLFVK